MQNRRSSREITAITQYSRSQDDIFEGIISHCRTTSHAGLNHIPKIHGFACCVGPVLKPASGSTEAGLIVLGGRFPKKTPREILVKPLVLQVGQVIALWLGVQFGNLNFIVQISPAPHLQDFKTRSIHQSGQASPRAVVKVKGQFVRDSGQRRRQECISSIFQDVEQVGHCKLWIMQAWKKVPPLRSKWQTKDLELSHPPPQKISDQQVRQICS